jgi:hypothetical protein
MMDHFPPDVIVKNMESPSTMRPPMLTEKCDKVAILDVKKE